MPVNGFGPVDDAHAPPAYLRIRGWIGNSFQTLFHF